ARVQVIDLVKRFDANVAVNQISLDIADGAFMVFLGPSGCGKTTTLRCIAGLEQPQSGSIRIDGHDVTRLPPSARDIAMVFQQYAIYPHMTVRQNLEFPLRAAHMPRSTVDERVIETATMLHIEKLLERRPGKLSGGEMQRVAIGRAMVRRPQVFLMDEPLSNLDAKLRAEMRSEIKRLQNDQRATTVYVTHDQLEAMSMADQIAVMYGGILQQVGSPADVYDRPANLFVAGFIGSPAMNFLPCRLRTASHVFAVEGASEVPIQSPAVPRFERATDSGSYVLGIRPEDIALSVEPKPEFTEAEVYVVEPLGSENIVNVVIGGKIVKVRTAPTFTARPKERLYVRFEHTRCHLFDMETTEAVSR
ncbi:MAG: ABC transporter ATP-binding protein, partial [Armatimonadetes bacterium]|nr:ABC transporter ATP-binding protein [Armatimonadota bacterium]